MNASTNNEWVETLFPRKVAVSYEATSGGEWFYDDVVLVLPRFFSGYISHSCMGAKVMGGNSLHYAYWSAYDDIVNGEAVTGYSCKFVKDETETQVKIAVPKKNNDPEVFRCYIHETCAS